MGLRRGTNTRGAAMLRETWGWKMRAIGLAAVMEVPYLFNPAVNLLSFVFSAGIGVLFGYFPARRAARLDPIEALRHE